MTSARQAVALTRYILSHYSIDPGKVYLEGYSGGGLFAHDEKVMGFSAGGILAGEQLLHYAQWLEDVFAGN